MKKIFTSLLCLTMISSLISCKNNYPNPSISSTNSSESSLSSSDSSDNQSFSSSSEVVSIDKSSLEAFYDKTPTRAIIHFQNTDKDYENLTYWFWSKSYKPEKEVDAIGYDDFGMYTEIPLEKFTSKKEDALWFLVKSKGTWAYKTVDLEIKYTEYPSYLINDEYVIEIYANALSKSNVELSHYYDPNADSILYSEFLDKKKIRIEATGVVASYKIYKYTKEYYKETSPLNSKYLWFENNNVHEQKFNINIPEDLEYDYHATYRIEVVFENGSLNKKPILSTKIYQSAEFDNFYYDGELGACFDEEGNLSFKVFAPSAAYVRVNIYSRGYPSSYSPTPLKENDKSVYDDPLFTIDLNPTAEGIFTSDGVTNSDWDNSIRRNIITKGKYYYTYTVANQTGLHEVIDPYARATSVNSLRAYIPSLDNEEAMPENFKALPKVWDNDPVYDIESPLDLVISENHIRDLTAHPTWSDNEEYLQYKETFKGFGLKNTSYTKDGKTYKTGADHLEEYGVNAIQLLPIFDQDNDDTSSTYNWGYNPLNYNIVEGQYSTDPYNPFTRIYELREMIANYATNKNKTRMIMDVVYNHVANAANSNFEFICPNYYFRLDENGDYIDNSGCNNEFNSSRPMARKFIVDSVMHWAKNYCIKGFRFDLMGLLDVETMKQVKEALYNYDKDIVVYGEGWDATGAYYADKTHATTQEVYSQLYHSEESPGFVGGFNDAGRNALRGENSSQNSYPGYGFISQGEGDLSLTTINKISDAFKGIHNGKGANPLQCINYASCHDNYTLFDQLNYTLSEDGGKTEPNILDVLKASVAVNGFILMSNGIAFINGGEELFRSKVEIDEESPYAVEMYGRYISHNSYKSDVLVNAYDYERKADYYKYFEMYKNLVSLRKNLTPILFPENCDNKERIDTWDIGSKTRISCFREGKDNKNYYVFLNGRSPSQTFNFGEGEVLFTNGSTFLRNTNGLSVNSKYALGIYTL